MPWKECSIMDQREEFVRLAQVEGANVSALCRRLGISRKSGYKWLSRFRAGGPAALADRSRRPQHCPQQSPVVVETAVLALREEHRSWGGRKIAARLQKLGQAGVPSPSAITRILHRHGRIDPEETWCRQAVRRFEYAAPNELWQMDFKGHLALGCGPRCHPLTVLDDHSRYALVLQACANERTATVREHLTAAFRRYGLPQRLLCDNGSPWGTSGGRIEDQWTVLTVWLLRLGIQVLHGHPYHPQTQGKEERFHRTLRSDLLRWQVLPDLAEAQKRFDEYRTTYNYVRPHEALRMACPGQRYVVSTRNYPETLPQVEYGAGELVRQVTGIGRISLRNKPYVLGKPFAGQAVALRPTLREGYWEVFFGPQRIGWIDEVEGETWGPRAGDPLAALADRPPAE
jgi:transposase InsO family protein